MPNYSPNQSNGGYTMFKWDVLPVSIPEHAGPSCQCPEIFPKTNMKIFNKLAFLMVKKTPIFAVFFKYECV